MKFHDLEAAPNYEDVMKFQEAERTNQGARGAFLQKYKGTPKYDEQIMDIIAHKMSHHEGMGLRKCGYFIRRCGNPVETDKSK